MLNIVQTDQVRRYFLYDWEESFIALWWVAEMRGVQIGFCRRLEVVTGVEESEVVAGSGLAWWKIWRIIYVIMKKVEEKNKVSFAAVKR